MAELLIHTNSYVTLEEADEYVNTHYLSNSPERVAWSNPNLPESDKVVALISSATALNNLKYKGRKARAGQLLAFPRRHVSFPGSMMLPYVPQLYDGSLIEGVSGGNGLYAAKSAQIVNAIAHLTLDPKIYNEVVGRTATGIRSRKLGSIAEDYTGAEKRTKSLLKGLYAKDKIDHILVDWLSQSIHSL